MRLASLRPPGSSVVSVCVCVATNLNLDTTTIKPAGEQGQWRPGLVFNKTVF